jgi:hypothetical protein
MNDEKYSPNDLYELLIRNKIATLDDLKTVLKTKSTMTVFRKMKRLEYVSSYSHRGKYYSLNEIADYNVYGIWSHQSVWFSKYGNLVETAKDLIDSASAGYTAKELETIVHVETKHALLNLFRTKRADRENIGNGLVYFSADKTSNKRQRLNRKHLSEQMHFDLSCEIDTQSNELKAAIILFFSLLDEKQRRLFAGLEAFKIGHGGDKRIADLLGLDVHTVAKGRSEIFSGSVQFDGVRKKGSGRKPVEKKRRPSSKESND